MMLRAEELSQDGHLVQIIESNPRGSVINITWLLFKSFDVNELVNHSTAPNAKQIEQGEKTD